MTDLTALWPLIPLGATFLAAWVLIRLTKAFVTALYG